MTTTYILDDVLVQQDLVGHLCEGRILQINFRLARGSDFVMMNLDDDTAFLEGANHLGSNVLLMIHRRDGEVTFLVSRFVAEIRFGAVARIPETLFRINVVEALVVRLIETNIVKNIKLDFWSPITGVGDSSRLQILLGLLRDVARVTRIRLARERIA